MWFTLGFFNPFLSLEAKLGWVYLPFLSCSSVTHTRKQTHFSVPSPQHLNILGNPESCTWWYICFSYWKRCHKGSCIIKKNLTLWSIFKWWTKYEQTKPKIFLKPCVCAALYYRTLSGHRRTRERFPNNTWVIISPEGSWIRLGQDVGVSTWLFHLENIRRKELM